MTLSEFAGLYKRTSIAMISKILLLSTIMFVLCSCEKHMIGILNPKGIVVLEQRKLFFDTLALMLIVVLPVIIMSFTFIYHYQVSHHLKDYEPNWSHSYFLESLWWGIPCAIIVVLAILTYKKTHELDPYRAIPFHPPVALQVQAIALPWKWLFIYPQYNIASLNQLVIPIGTQVEFFVTADNVPMSAFFIPQLGSQIYGMAGMKTRLHIIANQLGVYDGMNAQYNGAGFSDMHFPVYVVSHAVMQQWVQDVKRLNPELNEDTYKQILNPSINSPAQFYSSTPEQLFQKIIELYMMTYGTKHPRDTQQYFIEIQHKMSNEHA